VAAKNHRNGGNGGEENNLAAKLSREGGLSNLTAEKARYLAIQSVISAS